MEWNQPLNNYCERLDASFWAEPLNALSNLSFIVAALLAWRYGRERRLHTPGSMWLVLLLLIIGVGSFLFHTFANVWSLYADVLPIYIFQLSYLGLYGAWLAREDCGIPWRGAAVFVGLFMLLSMLFGQLPVHWLNGSLMYFPAWLMLMLIAVHRLNTAQQHRYTMLAAVGVFTVSLLCRSLDMAVCLGFSVGTHFLWHLFNGVMLYLVIRVYLDLSQRKRSET